MYKIFHLRGGRTFTVGKKTLVMGILNITPDSFSDGGKYFFSDAAIAHATQLVEDGADIIDVGAESTRPNCTPISADEEISRLEKILPLLKNLKVPISIDTYKPEVAIKALELGADILNDVQGLEDSRMIEVGKKFGVPLIAMHNEKSYGGIDIIDDIKKFFRQTIENCKSRAFDISQVIFDPGIGFGSKTTDDDLTILRRLDELKFIDGQEIPLLLGASRKKFIGYSTGLEVHQRDEATGAICVHAISKGVDIVRVHNVRAIARMCRMSDIIMKGETFNV